MGNNISELERIRVEYTSYGSLIDKVGLNKIEERYNKIEGIFQSFLKNAELESIFYLNKRILLIAILDFFSDILRLREYHSIKEINEIKMKAYETSWILRRKPIQVRPESLAGLPENDYINEQAVFDYLTSYLLDGQKIESAEIYEEMTGFFDTLYYYLRFRDCEPRALEMALHAFQVGVCFGKKTKN